MARDERVLVVAAWGLPPSWKKVSYRVGVEHPRFRGLLEGYECTTCSSTIALMAGLRRAGFSVEALILGLDTLEQPSPGLSGEEFRERIRERYREYYGSLLAMSSCRRDAEEAEARIEALPGRGSYGGWRYLGSIDALFNKAFSLVLERLGGMGKAWIFLDVTHGVNFQTIAVLYATIAAAIVSGLEDRLIMVNSEPPTSRETCIPSRKEAVDSGTATSQATNLVDVTRLQEAVKFTRLIRSIRELGSPSLLRQAIRDLRRRSREGERLASYIEESVLPFIALLANGVVAPTYPGSGLGLNPCQGYRGELAGEGVVLDYVPVIDYSSRVVRYPEASIYESLRLGLARILESLCSELDTSSLEDYLRSVARLYDRLGYKSKYLVAKRTLEEIEAIMGYLRRGGGDLENEGLNTYAFRILLDNMHLVTKALRTGGRVFDSWRSLEENAAILVRRHLEEAEKASKESQLSERDIRNMAAHAGLEYKYLWSLVVRDGRIKEIRYREGSWLEALLKKLYT